MQEYREWNARSEQNATPVKTRARISTIRIRYIMEYIYI
jgi:hypothetical protein